MAKQDKKSKALTVLILLAVMAWAGLVGAYLARTLSLQQRRLESGEIQRPGAQVVEWDRERWSGIYQGRTKIGYLFSRLRKRREGFDLWSKTRIRLTLMDVAQEIKIDLQGHLNPDYSLKDFMFEALSDFMEIKAKGRMKGDKLLLTLWTGGQEVSHEILLPKPPTMEMEWLLEDKLRQAATGDEFQFEIFEPMTQKPLPIQVKVLSEEEQNIMGRSRPCYKLEISLAGQKEFAWVDKETGEVVKEYHPGTGFTTVLEDKDTALEVDWEAAGKVDFLLTFMVPSDRELPSPRSVRYLKARLVGAPLEGLDLEGGERQKARGNEVQVRVEENIPRPGYELPITRSLPGKASEFSEWLSPTPFIQSGHPRIKAEAEKALQGLSRSSEAVRRLVEWVHEEVEPSLVTSIPSALEVLEKKKGACKEHTVLFIALARAAGIPARTVSGIVYSDEQAIPGFYYHAWAEVFLADEEGRGRWVAVDPTFGQVPADATHIKLVEGDLERMLNLMQVMGKLRVKVEEVQ